MAFRVLSESEVNTLSERQKKLYLEELELYQERCAFVDRIEELENVFLPEMLDEKDDVKKMEKMTLELSKA